MCERGKRGATKVVLSLEQELEKKGDGGGIRVVRLRAYNVKVTWLTEESKEREKNGVEIVREKEFVKFCLKIEVRSQMMSDLKLIRFQEAIL